MATTQAEHRQKAEELLALAKSYPHNSAARLATLTEAQVHAILALDHLDDHGTAASPEVDSLLIDATLAQAAADAVTEELAPKTPRRTRKAASTPKEG